MSLGTTIYTTGFTFDANIYAKLLAFMVTPNNINNDSQVFFSRVVHILGPLETLYSNLFQFCWWRSIHANFAQGTI
jgi:hypothetical protein